MSLRLGGVLLCILSCALLPLRAEVSLNRLLSAPESWELPQHSFLSPGWQQGRFPGELMYSRDCKVPLFFYGIPVIEGVCRFREGRLQQVYLLLSLDDRRLHVLTSDAVREVLSRFYKNTPTPGRLPFPIPAGENVRVERWSRGFPVAELTAVAGRYSFVALTLSRDHSTRGCRAVAEPLAMPMRRALPGFTWRTTLTRQLNAAGIELEQPYVRLLTLNEEERALERSGRSLGFISEVIEFQTPEMARANSLSLLGTYNRLAHAAQKTEIPLEYSGSTKIWNDSFRRMDPVVLRQCPIPEQIRVERFCAEVEKALSAKLPVGWTVVRHTGKQRLRRLIVGIDPQKELLYFSENRGFVREIESMPIKGACVMTTRLHIIRPQSSR